MLGKTRGNRGELTALPLSSKPERYEALREVYLCSDRLRPAVRSRSPHGFTTARLIFKFRGIDTISDAEKLARREVRVPVQRAHAARAGRVLPESDLIGCEVVDRQTGESLGRVTGWEDGGGRGLLVLDGNLLIPFVRAICVEIDPAARRIAVELPEGFEGIEPAVIFHVLTIFPEFFAGPFAHGVVKRARDAGLLEIRIHNLRDWTYDRHKTVDDRPFGGGEGMVLKPEPIFLAVESIWPERSTAAERLHCFPRRAGCSTRSMANR